MNDSIMDMDDGMLQQLGAGGGGDGNSADNTFSMATGIHLRKNLASKFDEVEEPPRKKQALKENPKRTTRSATAATRFELPPKKEKAAKLSSSSSATATSSVSIMDRIAKFERNSSTTALAPTGSASMARPPLPIAIPQASNAIPPNRMSVYLRIRPTSEESTIQIVSNSASPKLPTTVRTFPSEQSKAALAKEYSFHQVLDPTTTQAAVYSTVAAPLVAKLCEGISSSSAKVSSPPSALLFSYGITNAGKTHTILGDVASPNDQKWGVLPRAMADMLNRGKFELSISFFEIYNEQIFDLLPKESAKKASNMPPQSLKLSERNGQTIVRGLAHHRVSSMERGLALIQQAHNRRKTSSNNINVDSSRSHCVCQLELVRASQKVAGLQDDDSVVSLSGYSTDEEAAVWSQRKTATMWIVDLAGSERSKRTGLSGRQKESSQINKSLMTLMRCLTVMRENNSSRQRHSAIIPFRESKLTHLFMGHLTGSSARHTAMIVNANPRAVDFDETQHVLAYASKSKTIDMDHGQKRKRAPSADLYDSDGRRVQPKRKMQAAKLIKKVVRKLSPKKAAKRLSPPRRSLRERHDKVAKKSSKDAALQQALAENEELRKHNARLEAELHNIESRVRSEVVDEMDGHMAYTTNSYKTEIMELREELEYYKLNHGRTRSAMKATENRVKEHMDELTDQVIECEEEMVRMREAHNKELAEAHETIRRMEQNKIELIQSYESMQQENNPVESKGSKVTELVVARKPLGVRNQ